MSPAPGTRPSSAAEVEAAGLALRDSGWFLGGDSVLAAVSGGVDSMVLLYLLLFVAGLERDRLQVGHLDHGAREGSAADARWLQGICRAWGVAYHGGRMEESMATEEEGRRARYGFLERVRKEVGAAAVLTAHTADDQAETVLFRMARGSGLRGLAGIRPLGPGSVHRPLLGVWRAGVEAFARRRSVPFRVDPTNRDLRWTRNRLRHDVLPSLEAAVPGARKALARLASLAAADTRALAELADALLVAWGDATSGGVFEVGAERLASLGDEALSALLRRACQRAGASPGPAATRALVDFVRSPGKKGSLDAGGGVRVQRSMGRIRVSSVAPPQPGGPPAPGEAPGGLALTREGGRGRWRVGGTEVDVAWGEQRPRGYAHVASLPLEGLRFPLVLRPRLPGDRIGGAGDGGKVKKILARDRVPSFARDDVPILADGTGTVLWVVGHSDPASSFGPGPHPSPFYVALRTAAGGTES